MGASQSFTLFRRSYFSPFGWIDPGATTYAPRLNVDVGEQPGRELRRIRRQAHVHVLAAGAGADARAVVDRHAHVAQRVDRAVERDALWQAANIHVEHKQAVQPNAGVLGVVCVELVPRLEAAGRLLRAVLQGKDREWSCVGSGHKGSLPS